jgi:hypothetical protein
MCSIFPFTSPFHDFRAVRDADLEHSYPRLEENSLNTIPLSSVPPLCVQPQVTASQATWRLPELCLSIMLHRERCTELYEYLVSSPTYLLHPFFMMICKTAKLESLTLMGMKLNCTRQSDRSFHLCFHTSISKLRTDNDSATGPPMIL